MNVVDSSAWLEYFADGPQASVFAKPIAATESLIAPVLSVRHRLPMADSVMLATARRRGAVLWTQDGDFEGLEGVQYFPKS